MDVPDALRIIRNIVEETMEMHERYSEEWRQYAKEHGISLFNQKSNKVIQLKNNEAMFDAVQEYLLFLSEKSELNLVESGTEGYILNQRVKQFNSVVEKIEDYCNYRSEKGKVDISKCLNDLFGRRIVIDCDSLTHEDVCSIIDNNKEHLTCIKRDVPGKDTHYVATHIYFKIDNKTFRWELQVWKESDAKSNQISHATHRYKYKKWEDATDGQTLHNTQ